MMSGDGLIVRVRPRAGKLTAGQLRNLALLSQKYGNGVIDLTSRANLQIRGVAEADYASLPEELLAANLLDPTPADEARRNVLTTPFWSEGDGTEALHDRLVAELERLPALPAKMGIALDTGHHPVLAAVSADFRFERGREVPLILRADGAVTGVAVTSDTMMPQLAALAQWFVASGGSEAGRMRKHLASVTLPARFQGAVPAEPATPPDAGAHPNGFLVGVAFGAMNAESLLTLIDTTGVCVVRVTPWRLLLLEGVDQVLTDDFITAPGSLLTTVHACPGAPLCSQAEAETRALAQRLAPGIPDGRLLHVSGCAKGCALPRTADITLVGVRGKFDLVRAGTAWDEPETRGRSADEIEKDLTF